MDRDSIIGLQKLDCNCNDCKFMARRNDRVEAAKKLHRHWAARTIVSTRRYFWEEIVKKREKGKDSTGLERERASVTTNKSYTAGIAHGDCTKFDKPVQFIPNTISLDTQECFEHRRG